MKGDHHVEHPFSVAGLALAAALIPTPASAQMVCGQRDDILETLARKYQERPAAIGVESTGGLIEVLADIKSGSFTIIVTTPRGMSCLLASGEGWRMVPVERGPEA